MKVLHLEYGQYPSDSVQKLKHLAEVEAFDCKDQLDLYDKLSRSHCDVIFTRLGVMLDKHAMELAGELKYIVTSTTGLNHIDLKAASERNIHVVSLKGEAEFLATVKSTAEHAWGLLLSLMRNLPGAIDHVRQGGWERTPFLSE